MLKISYRDKLRSEFVTQWLLWGGTLMLLFLDLAFHPLVQ